MLVAAISGGAAISVEAIDRYKNDINKLNTLDIPLNELIDTLALPDAVKLISPGFHLWKLKKMIDKLDVPEKWVGDAILSQSKCQLSRRLTLFPVIDQCGHRFDYFSVNNYIESRPGTSKCPHSTNLLTLKDLKLDFSLFISVQNRVQELQNREKSA